MNASRSSEMVLDDIDIERSLVILEKTEKKMLHTFAGVGKSSHADVLAKVMLDITQAGEEGIWLSDLVTQYRDDADGWVMKKITETLKVMNFITEKITPNDTQLKYKPRKEREDAST